MFASLDQLRRQPVNIPSGSGRLEVGAALGVGDAAGAAWMGDGQIVAVDASNGVSEDAADAASAAGIHRWSAAPGFGFEPGVGAGNGVCLRSKAGRSEPADSCRANELRPGSAGGQYRDSLAAYGISRSRIHTLRWCCGKRNLGRMGKPSAACASIRAAALALGDRAILSYGGEYVLVGLGAAASSLRPRAKLDGGFRMIGMRH